MLEAATPPTGADRDAGHHADRGPPSRQPPIRCRPIEAADLPAVVRLLTGAFPYRTAAYWDRGFERLSRRAIPEGAVRFGHLLDRGGEPVGVLLTIYSAVEDEDAARLRCNLSSWYVVPEYRALGTVLDGHAMRDRSVTYLNLSPAAHTIAMHEARGFRRYCRGQMLVVPALCRPGRGQSVREAGPADEADLPPHVRDLVRDHAAWGCLCLVCREGPRVQVVILQRLPMKVSRRWSWLPRLPTLQMIYGPVGPELTRWLGAIGRHLLRAGTSPFLVVDADERIPGVVGRYLEGWRPRYGRGPVPVRVNDLSYTEITVFGP